MRMVSCLRIRCLSNTPVHTSLNSPPLPPLPPPLTNSLQFLLPPVSNISLSFHSPIQFPRPLLLRFLSFRLFTNSGSHQINDVRMLSLRDLRREEASELPRLPLAWSLISLSLRLVFLHLLDISSREGE